MTEPVWLEVKEALVLHERILARNGGAAGVRDLTLLESAIARPRQVYAYGSPDVVEMANACTCGVVQNHPFVDGNKRTGFILGILFLELNGWQFRATEEAATHGVLKLASGEWQEHDYGEFLRASSSGPG